MKLKTFIATLAVAILGTGLSGCSKHEDIFISDMPESAYKGIYWLTIEEGGKSLDKEDQFVIYFSENSKDVTLLKYHAPTEKFKRYKSFSYKKTYKDTYFFNGLFLFEGFSYKPMAKISMLYIDEEDTTFIKIDYQEGYYKQAEDGRTEWKTTIRHEWKATPLKTGTKVSQLDNKSFAVE